MRSWAGTWPGRALVQFNRWPDVGVTLAQPGSELPERGHGAGGVHYCWKHSATWPTAWIVAASHSLELCIASKISAPPFNAALASTSRRLYRMRGAVLGQRGRPAVFAGECASLPDSWPRCLLGHGLLER